MAVGREEECGRRGIFRRSIRKSELTRRGVEILVGQVLNVDSIEIYVGWNNFLLVVVTDTFTRQTSPDLSKSNSFAYRSFPMSVN